MPKYTSTTTTKAARTAASTRPSKEDAKAKAAAKVDRKQAWEKHCKQNYWRVNYRFRQPSWIEATTAGCAAKLDGVSSQLKKFELDTLPHEQGISKAGYSMKMYNPEDVRRLIREREAFFDLDQPLPGRKTTVSQTQAPALCVPKLEAAAPVEGPFAARLKAEGAVIRRDYKPPQGVSEDDPEPKDILWEGKNVWGNFGIEEEDACLLYCLKPKHLDPIRGTSVWFDLQTVAVRALEVHGGVRKHNEMYVPVSQLERVVNEY
ncbi:hypothetical protein CC2G_004116 [Coprinopsis cinerea AmutBmut pab1-1]|nr:hypothetical protein CC2G_004116 [Coprinopsis cinerea AmutBmut pab1-1]